MSLFSRIHYAMLLQQTTATTSASNENNNRKKRMLDTEIFMPLYRKQQRRDFYFWQYAIAVKRIKAKTMCPHCCMECRQYTRTTPLMLDGIALHCKQFPIVLATQHHFHFFDCALGNCHPKLSQCCGCINFMVHIAADDPNCSLETSENGRAHDFMMFNEQTSGSGARLPSISFARSFADRSIDATLTLGPFGKCALTSCTAVNSALFFAHFHFPCFVSSFFSIFVDFCLSFFGICISVCFSNFFTAFLFFFLSTYCIFIALRRIDKRIRKCLQSSFDLICFAQWTLYKCMKKCCSRTSHLTCEFCVFVVVLWSSVKVKIFQFQ